MIFQKMQLFPIYVKTTKTDIEPEEKGAFVDKFKKMRHVRIFMKSCVRQPYLL